MNTDDVIALGLARRPALSNAARALRIVANVKAADVARAIDVSPSRLSLWEKAKRTPSGEAGVRYGYFLRELMRTDEP